MGKYLEEKLKSKTKKSNSSPILIKAPEKITKLNIFLERNQFWY